MIMSGEIKKIDSIDNMAVFQNFQWADSVRDKGNNIAEFKRLNILYGRNYSGKTTLSRIFRAMETGSISEKYDSPEFKVSFESGEAITQTALIDHKQVIRVFNEDFVKENLRFIVDDEHAINPFAILGADNTTLKKEITHLQDELGSEDGKTGLIGEMLKAEECYEFAKRTYKHKSSDLEDMLRNKANNPESGIKHNKAFGDANYDITKIKKDIEIVCKESYNQVTAEQIDSYHDLLKEEPKKPIPPITSFNLSYTNYATKVKELVEKEIKVSVPIQELLSNAILEKWVREGRDHHHKGKRTQCAFCGSDLPSGLWDKLDEHFNKSSESLRDDIDQLLKSIAIEKTHISKLLTINNADFYSKFHSELQTLEEQFNICSASYSENLDVLKSQLENRKSNIFNHQAFVEPTSAEKSLSEILGEYKSLCGKSNQFTDSLSSKQSDKRIALRLSEVCTFIKDIGYSKKSEDVETYKEAMKKAKQGLDDARVAVYAKESQIEVLKAQLKDESKGAGRVNEYLNNYFGHQSLSLKAIENMEEGQASGYRYEVIRNDEKAYHLSEGECSLIAFCYFMAKLEDVETKGSQPIVWIDDPVSSLDANHIFFVYSLISTEIVTKNKAKQLFISTHNMEFLKYLKRLPGASDKKKSEYFIINRVVNKSDIALMPKYLKDYVTEFNFLFHQIYKCANASGMDDQNYQDFYNFGNNARKFLEVYLYYKYPDETEYDSKLQKFFGDERVPVILTNRITNEHSHLSGVFERGASPVDVPEMQSVANQILSKINEDQDQYNALLQSIGEQPHEPDLME